jgi:iron transport multicopper oxidase
MKRVSSHIHGHKFWIVERSSNFSSTDPSVITKANLNNPLARDVILIESGGSATLRCVSKILQFCKKKLDS